MLNFKLFSYATLIIFLFNYNYSQSQSNSDFQATWNKQLDILLNNQVFSLEQESAIKKGTGFCYTTDKNDDETSFGPNANDQVKLASITKIFTSLAALTSIDQQFHNQLNRYQKTAKDFLFTTTLEIYQTKTQDGYTYRANLIGGYDPLFDLKKLAWLISLLNEKNITKLSELHFTSAFLFQPNAKSNSSSFREPEKFFEGPTLPDEEQMVNWLTNYFNFSSSHNVATFKTINALKKALLEKSQSTSTINLVGINSSNLVKMSLDQPPILDDHFTLNPNENLAFRMHLYSAPLGKIIKFMNTQSNNWIAESLFHFIGGQDNFRNILQSVMPSLSNETIFYTGSGLPSFIPGTKDRLNNSALCSEVLIAAKNLYLWEQNSDPINPMNLNFLNNNLSVAMPQNFLGMTGEGTLERYAKDPANGKPGITFIGKTGTTNDAVNLFSTTSTTQGKIHLLLFSNLPDENYLRVYRRGRWIDDKLNIFQTNTRNFYFSIMQNFFTESFTYTPPTFPNYDANDLSRELNLTSETLTFLNISNHRFEIIDQRFQ